jgi:outer membrane protein assembly factor BamB
MKIMFTKLAPTAVILLALPILSASAGEKPFPKIVPALDGSFPEGFAIGKGTTAYNGSIDGSIYKVNLRNGEGEILVPADDPFVGCTKLGMRVDRRSNNLIVAGCEVGNALVYDADTGEPIMEYQLDDSGGSAINDLAITQDTVYFTDFYQPFIYSLPLSKNGRIPEDADASTAIPLIGDFENCDNEGGIFANGIVATPDGNTLIIGHSGCSKIFKVDPTTGDSDEIIIDPPLLGLLDGSFLDGIVSYDGLLYILSPGDTADLDLVQVVVLDEDMLTGSLVGTISDSDMDGVASGAMHGDSLYVNNARYGDQGDIAQWITKLNIYDVEPVE